ncbi:MAG: FAD-dependent oxidoreductase, partial [Rhodothermia bacterium]|nr:FAD-dependent oxidoreductase [Rhodothermia bacterium]
VSVTQQQERVNIRTHEGKNLGAHRIILAVGAGFRHIDGIPPLNLHLVKGQTVSIDRTATPYSQSDIPHIAGRGYVVSGSSRFTIGSSYQHDFADLAPNPRASEEILDRARANLPLLTAVDEIKEAAGIRDNVPGTRLPMVGPLPGADRIWIFTGLGSKGLLMAPLIARDLPSYLETPGRIPVQTRVAELPAG